MTTTEIAGLTTRVVDDCEKPQLAVILCHGFGAGGDDLVPIGAEMLSRSEKLAAGARFYFPAAPLDLSSMGMWGSRAWWMIDMEAIQRAQADGSFRKRARNERPEGLLEAREAVMGVVKHVQQETGLPVSKIALGGFSQGSMITLDVALQLEENPAAVIAWSGTLLNEEEWRERGKLHAGLKVFQSHGRQDPLLPYDWAESLRDMLKDIGAEVEFLPFNGPHTIPEQGLDRAVALLESALEREA
jgi:phospholipase/carboxylesterase